MEIAIVLMLLGSSCCCRPNRLAGAALGAKVTDSATTIAAANGREIHGFVAHWPTRSGFSTLAWTCRKRYAPDGRRSLADWASVVLELGGVVVGAA